MPPEQTRNASPHIRRRTIELCFELSIAATGLILVLMYLARPRTLPVSTEQFELLTLPQGFALQFSSNGKTTQVAIPRDWLVPPQEEKEEKDWYVSPFHYDKVISSFPIGNGQMGLHLSSYEVQKEGSADGALGKDVFLIFDPASLNISRGGIERGMTKGHVRDEGCFRAKDERYFLGDVDADGVTDIGVVTEELECFRFFTQDQFMEGPSYEREPVVWYVFRNNAWKLDASLSGNFPKHYQELPLIGMEKTPVDYVGCNLWETCDRTKWPKAKRIQEK
jgi:hypothetical protein